jgi:hypothetical protein
MPTSLHNLFKAPKPSIQIHIDDGHRTFTTHDAIHGTVSISSEIDVQFTDLQIQFLGTSRSHVENYSTALARSGRREAFHIFLRLAQPELQHFFPKDNVLRAGQTYEFPFVFVVPDRLLPSVCKHRVASPAVRTAHLQLPPTMGDPDLDGSLPHDTAPDHASIRYGVFARLLADRPGGISIRSTTLASQARKVRIVPSCSLPKSVVQSPDMGCEQRTEKLLRSGVFKQKVGTLVVEAVGLGTSELPRPGPRHHKPEPTAVRLTLRFDPSSHDGDLLPPESCNIQVELDTCTFFGSTARRDFAGSVKDMEDLSLGMHSHRRLLHQVEARNIQWVAWGAGRLGLCEGTEIPGPSEGYKGGAYHTSKIDMAVAIPCEGLVPTFHSCLLSRVYSLNVGLDVPGTSHLWKKITVSVPLHVSTEHFQSSQRPGRVDSCIAGQVPLAGEAGSAEYMGSFGEVRGGTADVLPGYSQ